MYTSVLYVHLGKQTSSSLNDHTEALKFQDVVNRLGTAEALRIWEAATPNDGIRMYRMPNFADVPPIQVFFAVNEDTVGPFGAKGCAESPIDPVAPAIANADAHATRVRFRDLPLVPPLIFEKLYTTYLQRTAAV